MPRRTPRSLNQSLRLGRLTAPQWAACVVGAASLWLCSSIAAHVADLNTHLLAVVLPTMLVVTPILTLWRGGVERYPAQVMRYAVRQSVVYATMTARLAVVYVTRAGRTAGAVARKGGSYANARLQAARRRQS